MCNAKILAQLALGGTFLKHSKRNDSDTSHLQTAKASITENCLGAFISSSLLLQPSVLRVNKTSAERQMFQRRSWADELWKAPMSFPQLTLQMCWRMGGMVCTPLPCKTDGHSLLLERFGAEGNAECGVSPLNTLLSQPLCAGHKHPPHLPPSPPRHTKHSVIPACPTAQKTLRYLGSWPRSRRDARSPCSAPGTAGTSQPATSRGCRTHGAGTGWHWGVLT